jgi:dTDP-4-dehydrorhamnose 3,5-epimerase-like enzyme
LSFFDQSIHIELPFRKEELIISEKDNILPTFEEASTEFYFS